MAWFSDWWSGLVLIEQVFYCIAIPSSLFLVVQAILIVVGGSDSDGGDGSSIDLDSDFDSTGVPTDLGAANMFTLQGVASFFCVFGWSSLLMYRGGIPLILVILLAVVFGTAVMYALARIMLQLNKLAHCGTLDVKNLLGNSGTVYLRIPPKGEGSGKVTIQTSERLVEFEAVSEAEEEIANNAQIRVIDIVGENVLVVERQ